jgi:hypothetical protein
MRWSAKIPTAFQIHKYTLPNIEHYLQYIEWVQSVQDWSKYVSYYVSDDLLYRIHFLDESHFSRRKLKKNKVWGCKSKRVYTRDSTLCMLAS